MAGHGTTGSAVASLATAVAGSLLVMSVFGPMSTQGIGSAISNRELAALLLGGAVEAWAPRWSGLALYLHPICGAAFLIGRGVEGRRGRIVSATALLVAALGQGIVILGLDWRPLTAPGWGALLVYVAILLGLASLVLEDRHARRVAQQV